MSEQQADESWRGPVGQMDQAQIDAFLKEGRLCRLACLDQDGWPYIVPVWFHHADGGIYVIPRERSVWARYIERDGRVSLAIDEESAPYRKVLIRGQAEVIEQPNVGGKWGEIANEMSYRYLGEHGPDYLVPTMNEPRWLLFVRPIRVTTWSGVDWAKRYKHYAWGT
jgi:PPOX class probable F420-dependent enzyme